MTPAGSMLDWLSRPESYPDGSGGVEIITTDESVIALVGEMVYKVCLPVKSDDRDLSTPALREKSLQRELRLNRRLGGDIYLDVLAISRSDDGWTFGGDGAAVEYALRMKRLAADRMMPSLLASGSVTEEDLDSLGDLLAEFYSSAKTVSRSAKMEPTEAIESAIHQAMAPLQESHADRDQLARIEPALLLFVCQHRELFEKRFVQGKIRECHGDLRSDHICLVRPPIVIGSIDSKDRPRQIDILSDLAVLLVDTEFAGHGDIGWRVWQRLAGRLNEPIDSSLLFFYRSFRAMMLARREAIRENPDDAVLARWLEIAAHHARSIHQPRLFVTVGLMGTGKTTLSEALVNDLGLTRLSSEDVGNVLYPSGAEGKSKANRLNPEHRDRIYGDLLGQIESALTKGISVVVDGSYLQRRHREAVLELASRLGIVPLFLECRLAKSETIARLDRRYKKNRTRPGSRPELLEDQSGLYEPPDELPAENVLVLNMNQPVPRLVEIVRESL
jgi:aminoglycoside phosphotransferase family enzyme/predicted kinase